MSAPVRAPVVIPELLTLEETAEALRKTPATLRWMISQGTAPRSAKIGGRRMFRAADIAAHIEEAFNEQPD